jgi:hypothetical protein
MYEFALYLDLVRRELRVGRRRTEAICAELRSHLEAQARALEECGMGPEQAAAQAVARLGAPKEIATRLVASNCQCQREELLKAAWLGLIVGFAAHFAQGAVLSVAGLSRFWDLATAWRYSLVVGGGLGAVCALVTCRWRLRPRTIALAVGGLAAAFVGVLACLSDSGNFRSLASARYVVTIVVPVFSGGMALIALLVGHAVNRCVLSGQAALRQPCDYRGTT